MGIRLIKRGAETVDKVVEHQPTLGQITVVAQSWVNEFKERKSKPSLRMIGGERDFSGQMAFGRRS